MLTGPTGPCGRRIVRAVVVKHVGHHLKPPGVVDRHGTDLTSMFAPPCDSPSWGNTGLLQSVAEDVLVRTRRGRRKLLGFMKLTDFYLRQFRDLHEVRLAFTDHTVLIGRNDTG